MRNSNWFMYLLLMNKNRFIRVICSGCTVACFDSLKNNQLLRVVRLRIRLHTLCCTFTKNNRFIGVFWSEKDFTGQAVSCWFSKKNQLTGVIRLRFRLDWYSMFCADSAGNTAENTCARTVNGTPCKSYIDR